MKNLEGKFSNFLKLNECFELNFATILRKCEENTRKIEQNKKNNYLFIIVLGEIYLNLWKNFGIKKKFDQIQEKCEQILKENFQKF